MCSLCGSPIIVPIAGHGPSGVLGPNGEQEFVSQEGFKCRDCGATEEI